MAHWLRRGLSQPVKPRDLGVVGRDHLLARFTESGADPETFVYRCAAVEHDVPPFFIEAAFAYRGDDDEDGADIIEGFNFTPAIGGSPFRLEGHLADARVQDYDPIIAFVHLTSPGLDFLDRGKAQVALPAAVAGQIVGLVKGVTGKWTKQKRAEISRRAGADAALACDDPARPADDDQGSGLWGDAKRLHGGERERHAARQPAPDLLRGARPSPRNNRPNGAQQPVLHADAAGRLRRRAGRRLGHRVGRQGPGPLSRALIVDE